MRARGIRRMPAAWLLSADRQAASVALGVGVACKKQGPVMVKAAIGALGAEAHAHQRLRRPAQPEEIAPAYVFLASPQTSSYITGEVLPILGGYSGG